MDILHGLSTGIANIASVLDYLKSISPIVVHLVKFRPEPWVCAKPRLAINYYGHDLTFASTISVDGISIFNPSLQVLGKSAFQCLLRLAPHITNQSQMASLRGIEPPTNGLEDHCSSFELQGHVVQSTSQLYVNAVKV